MKRSEARPKVIAITNENPDWPSLDKEYGDEMWSMLLDGLAEEGFTVRPFKFFDDLGFLDAFDSREWLVWNWGEEWAGQPWSDARVAEEIERRGFVYTGSSPRVLRFAQNRMALKSRLREAGLPTLPAMVCGEPACGAAWTDFPAIVKGANQHASVGIDRESVVESTEALMRRIEHLRVAHDDDALIEPFLDTREFQVAVWGNTPPVVLPPCEMVYSAFSEMCDRLHTRDWKVDRASRGYQEIGMPCPAPLDRPDWRARIEAVALDAYRVIGIRDYGRFDMRMRGDEPQILDVNVNPDLDAVSVVLAGAKAMGMTYGQMAAQIITFAAERMAAGR